jgi:YfiH family protein
MDNQNYFVRYRIFENYPEVFAFTTTKFTFNTKNIRFTNNKRSRSSLAKSIGINPEKLIYPKQTHSSCVAEISNVGDNYLTKTDALVTQTPGICIGVQTADCVPVLLFDPVKKVVAAVHAGWRGTVKKIVFEAVEKMKKYGTVPKDIRVAIGPSISMKNYEVGDEVIGNVKKSIPNAKKTFQKIQNNKYLFDLWQANAELLYSTGIQENNLQVLGECSFGNTDKYFSARRDGINTGRMFSGILLKK